MRNLHNVRTVVAGLLLVTGAVAGCVGSAANHESIGDHAYAEARFGEALVEYRLALARGGGNPSLRAKAGAAGLRAGDLVAAAEEFRAYGAAGGEERASEAADGLVRVANAAITRGDRAGLAEALQALQETAPGRVLGSFAPEAVAVLGDLPRGREALTILLYAAAGAPDARIQDSLMYAYGSVLRRMGRCEDAVKVYESLVRRQRDARVATVARDDLVSCALRLGRGALDNGMPTGAEAWFRLAATRGGTTNDGRLAYLGLGDVRFALGDVLGAIEAYEQARAGRGPGDSIHALVSERLNLIARPPSMPPQP